MENILPESLRQVFFVLVQELMHPLQLAGAQANRNEIAITPGRQLPIFQQQALLQQQFVEFEKMGVVGFVAEPVNAARTIVEQIGIKIL